MELLHSIWSTPNSNIPLVDSICPPILVGWCDQAIRATYEPYWSRFELILFWSKVWLKYLNQMIRIFKSNDWEKLIQKTNDQMLYLLYFVNGKFIAHRKYHYFYYYCKNFAFQDNSFRLSPPPKQIQDKVKGA